MQKVFCVYSRKQLADIAPIYYEHVIAGFVRVGAQPCEEFEFLSLWQKVATEQDAKVIVFFLEENVVKAVFASIKPQNRWAYLVDTKLNDADGTEPYAERIRQFTRLAVSHTIITYPIPHATQALSDTGVMTVVMPCCVSARRSRSRKYNGVVMTGTYDDKVYPTRSRLGRLFRDKLPGIAGVAVPRGTNGVGPVDERTAPSLKGEDYYQMLDGCQMAVVCRGGRRDCLVAKYVEFGMCHVLPIGDCPSYMPNDMKKLMVNVEGMSDTDVVYEIRRLLDTPEELYARQEAYCNAVHERYDLLTNAQRVLGSITSS